MLFSFRPTSVSRCFVSVIFESKMGVVVCTIGGIVDAGDVEFYRVYFKNLKMYIFKQIKPTINWQTAKGANGMVVILWQYGKNTIRYFDSGQASGHFLHSTVRCLSLPIYLIMHAHFCTKIIKCVCAYACTEFSLGLTFTLLTQLLLCCEIHLSMLTKYITFNAQYAQSNHGKNHSKIFLLCATSK